MNIDCKHTKKIPGKERNLNGDIVGIWFCPSCFLIMERDHIIFIDNKELNFTKALKKQFPKK